MTDGRNSPSAHGFIDRFAEDESRASSEMWERELQRLLISDGQPQGSDAGLIQRIVDSREEGASLELESLFAEDAQPQPGDAALVERLVDSCLEEPQAAPQRSRRFGRVAARAIWLAAALPLIGAVGWAASGAFEQKPAAPTTPQLQAPTPATASAAPTAKEPTKPPETPAPAIVESSSAKHQDAAQTERLAPAAPRLPARSPDGASPMRLFKDVKAARRAGKMGAFFELGRQLQAQYPESDEAQVSRMLLGRALLQGGSAAGAHRQFEAYRARGGAMVEEALVGQAQAAAQLGRRSSELDAWRTLVERFPASVHAPRAQQRIADLTAR